ncbi:MAG: hypothetical protein ACRDL3_15390 [Solirubrobacterales bacterium]
MEVTGSRERRRAERRKRKERSSKRDDPATIEADSNGEPAPLSRSELKDRAAREALVPLHEGERPPAVTVGAAVSTVIAAVFWVSAVVSVVTDIEVSGSEPQTAPLVLFAAVLTLMAWGMWRARYWAVLGFQALLALVMLSAGLGLVQVTTVLQAVGTVVVLAGAAALFYFMVKALARIQMPKRLPPR